MYICYINIINVYKNHGHNNMFKIKYCLWKMCENFQKARNQT